jgi:hypothetical protein
MEVRGVPGSKVMAFCTTDLLVGGGVFLLTTMMAAAAMIKSAKMITGDFILSF